MSELRPPRGAETPPHRILPSAPSSTAPAAARAAVVAAKAATGTNPPTAAVFAPWMPLLKAAESRYKAEISAALDALNRATVEAGQLLDQAQAMAAESGAHLERAAWDAWGRYMSAADTTRNDILGQAVARYDQLIAYATGQYGRAMDDAEKTYQSIANDATRAQGDVKSIAS